MLTSNEKMGVRMGVTERPNFIKTKHLNNVVVHLELVAA